MIDLNEIEEQIELLENLYLAQKYVKPGDEYFDNFKKRVEILEINLTSLEKGE